MRVHTKWLSLASTAWFRLKLMQAAMLARAARQRLGCPAAAQVPLASVQMSLPHPFTIALSWIPQSSLSSKCPIHFTEKHAIQTERLHD
eukprot:1537899-Amphidinium_carterae.1